MAKYVNIPMNVFSNINALMMQRRRFYAGIPMNVSSIINALMVQLGTSCSFDSPGLARNEPTPGKHSQGDSTPSVLSFFYEGTLTMKHFMADYTKKPQHLWRWFTLSTMCFMEKHHGMRIISTYNLFGWLNLFSVK